MSLQYLRPGNNFHENDAGFVSLAFLARPARLSHVSRARRKPPTQHDLAAAAGVAQITVSRALSGHPSVKEEVRERVLREAARLGYRLNRSANIMRRGRHHAVGLLATDNVSTSATPVGFFWGLEDACYARGLQLMISRYPQDVIKDHARLPQFLKTWMVDGVLLYYTHAIPAGLPELLDRMQTPFVWVNSNHDDGIKCDDEGAAAGLVEYLAKLGHTQISYAEALPLVDSEFEHYSLSARRQGYEKAMQDAGLAPTIINLKPRPGLTLQEGAAHWIAAADKIPTAFVTGSRWAALALVMALKTRNLHPPQDYSITTIDQSGFSNVGLNVTTQIVPNADLAEAALERLFALIDGSHIPPLEKVSFVFAEGKTCAPPPPNP